MNKEEKTRNLIRLKRHETPREGYFDDFLEEFRSRRDQISSPSTAPRREGWFSQWWNNGSKAKVVGFGIAYAAVVLMIVWWPMGEETAPGENRQPVIYEPEPGDHPLPNPSGREPETPRQ